ncbi:hypothetical protein HDG34_005878 [Paraburkholderia sp. HC6.4b]|uniref:host specificity factor TipJ family phage tail protein n=1 Tax=unclassified Paraburkholderia TaxID=2615204 RepID=UPI00160896DC|nr:MULTISPECIES: host specificity factor TipJ family phage tail protein [unclassified Paraburkholderia]MBB5411912.1 hypothetical protein [Paraburkholderia sp. HC6.4b]MBB5450224.1 hypothetical protein [Paraburkholderia sp. Kb1A]
MTVRINFFPEPTVMESCEAASVGEWLLARYAASGLPEGLRVYLGHCSEGSDITHDVAALMETEGEFEVCIMPGDPTFGVLTAVLIASLAVGVVMGVMAKKAAAPANANRTQSSPTNGLSGRSNMARVNQRRTDIRGRVSASVPDQLMVPYTKFVNNIEYEWSYMAVGVGRYATGNVRDGDTLLDSIPGSGIAFYGPGTSPNLGEPYATSGTPITDILWNVSQSSTINGQTLLAPNAIGANGATVTLVPTDQGKRIEVRPAAGVSFNFSSFISIGSELEIADGIVMVGIGLVNVVEYDREVGEVTRSFTANGYRSVDLSFDGYVVTNILDAFTVIVTGGPAWPAPSEWGGMGYGGSFYSVMSFATPPAVGYPLPGAGGQTVYSDSSTAYPGQSASFMMPAMTVSAISRARQVGAQVVPGSQEAWINLIAQSGLYKDDGRNTFDNPVTVTISLYETVKGVETGAFVSEQATVQSNGRDNAALTVVIGIPYAECTVYVGRITPTDLDFSGSVVDELKWRDLFSATAVPAMAFGDMTTIHVLRQATTGALAVRSPGISLDATRIITYGDTAGSPNPNFADVIWDMALDPRLGRLSSSQVDHDGLWETMGQAYAHFGSWEPIEVGYAFDTTDITFEESVSLICNAVNVTPYRMGGVLKFQFEGPQSTSAMQFVHRNKWPGTDTRTRSFTADQLYDGVELTYRDDEAGIPTVIRRPANDIAANPKRIEVSGCITPRGAAIRASREYNKLLYGRVSVQFDSFGIARSCLPSMRVDVADGTRGPTQDGEVIDQQGLTVFLSQPVTFTPGESHSIVLTRRDGSIEGIPCTPGADANSVVLGRAPLEDLFVGYLEAKTMYNFGSDTALKAEAMLVQTVAPQIQDGAEHITITCINYDDRYYQDDLAT